MFSPECTDRLCAYPASSYSVGTRALQGGEANRSTPSSAKTPVHTGFEYVQVTDIVWTVVGRKNLSLSGTES